MNNLFSVFNGYKTLGFMLLLLIYATPATGQTISAKLNGYIKSWSQNRHFSGAVLVAKKDKILLREGYGMANDRTKENVKPETPFRIASLTKSFTAMAIMQLAEQKKLNLSDPLSKYLPGYPKGDSITLFQIVHHTAGIPDFLDFPTYWEKLNDSCTVEEAVAIFKNKPLQFSPGSQWAYSNSGYVMLGFLIEIITKKSLADYFYENIFELLNMKHTGWESARPIETFGATGYYLEGENRRPTQSVNMSVNHGAGALYSTIDDLYKWDRALYTEKLLLKENLERIFTPHLNAYGGGWGIMTHQRFGKYYIFMNGRFSGFTAHISRYPDEDICIIILSNLMDIDPRIMADNLAAITFNQWVVEPLVRNQTTVSKSDLQEYAGKYFFEKMEPPLEITISVNAEEQLIRSINGRPDKILIPSSKNSFFYQDYDVDIIFKKDKTGNYNQMVMNLLGIPFLGIRT